MTEALSKKIAQQEQELQRAHLQASSTSSVEIIEGTATKAQHPPGSELMPQKKKRRTKKKGTPSTESADAEVPEATGETSSDNALPEPKKKKKKKPSAGEWETVVEKPNKRSRKTVGGSFQLISKDPNESGKNVIICYNCSDKGHIARNCPTKKSKRTPGISQKAPLRQSHAKAAKAAKKKKFMKTMDIITQGTGRIAKLGVFNPKTSKVDEAPSVIVESAKSEQKTK